MAAQLSTADLKKQREAAAARAAGQPVPLNTTIAPPAGTKPSSVAGQPNSAAAVDPFGQASALTAQNQADFGSSGPTAAQIAQLTGLDVHTVLAMQGATVDDGNGGRRPDIATQLQLQGLVNAAQQKKDNQSYITNNLNPAAATAGTNENTALQGMQSVAANQRNLAGGVMAGYGQAIGQQGQLANTANAADQQSLAGYGQALGAASGMQAGAYNQLASTFGGMSQLSAAPVNYNVQAQTSAAQLAGYQNAGLTLGGYTNADYKGYTADGYSANQAQYELANTSQADYQKAALQRAGLTRAQSDEGDVAAERGALGQLTNMAGGSLDTQNGTGSGGGSAAQQSALAQYGALTSPEATAKEKFLYENQRQAQEQQEAASRAALMNDYRVRGVGGSGMELGSILQAGQQNSQQRLLGDLGTQAGAVDRSMQALAGYGNLSSQMVAQGNQVNQANAANRLGAAGAQGQLASNIRGQSDALSMGNAGFANQNEQFNAGAFNQNAQFNSNAYNQNSQFNTGQSNMVGVANMNAYNQANQFNAGAVNDANRFNANANNDASAFTANAYNDTSRFNANAYNTNQAQNAVLANDNSQFNANAYNSNSQFNAGLVTQNNQFNNDQVNTTNRFNSEQTGIQSRFADSFAADQQRDAATRANDLATQGITVGQNFATNAGSLNTASRAATDASYGRGTDVTNLGIAGLTAGYNASTAANNMQNGVSSQQIANAGNQFNRSVAIGDAFMGAGNAGTTAIGQALNGASGNAAAKDAQDLASGTQDGFLGLYQVKKQPGPTTVKFTG